MKRRRPIQSRDWPLLPEQEAPAGAKVIRLTRQRVAWVDEKCYEALAEFNWSVSCSNRHSVWYAARAAGGKTIKMHREILSVAPGEKVDHRRAATALVLDNRHSNLRAATHAQNVRNARKCKRQSTSQYKGVWRNPSAWVASIQVDKRTIYLGSFRHEHYAALAYDAAARLYHGEFCLTNFPSVEGPVDVLEEAALCSP